jgi:hypothetical protein
MRNLKGKILKLVTIVSMVAGFLVGVNAPANANSPCVLGTDYTRVSASNSANLTLRFTNTTTCVFTIPASITSVTALVVGAGGGGGGDGGSGGGGGQLRQGAISVTAGNTISIKIGIGGVGSNWGGVASAKGGDSTITGVATFTAIGGNPGSGWGSNTGGAGGTGGTGGTTVINGQQGGGGPGGICNPIGLGSSPTGTVPSSNLTGSTVFFGGGGGGGFGAQTNNSGNGFLGAAGGTNSGGRGANYKISSADSSSAILGASNGYPGVANTGGGGGGGSACNARGDMNLGFDGVSQRTAGGAGANGVVFLQYSSTPSPVTNVSVASNQNSQVTITWTPPSYTGSGITGYRVQRVISGGGWEGEVATGSTADSYVYTGLTNGTEYFFRVTPVTDAGIAPFPGVGPFSSGIPAAPPGSPTSLSATPGNAQLSIAFTAGAANGSAISNYQYSTDSGATWKNRATGTTELTLVITTLSSSVASLVNGTSYTVVLRAINSAGNSVASASVTGIPNVIPTISTVPVISGTITQGQTLAVTNGTWANNPASYTYSWSRATTSGGSYSTISGATSSTYTLVEADIGNFVRATVTATNSAGNSIASSSGPTTSILGSALIPTFGIPIATSDGFTVQISNFNNSYSLAGTATAGSVSVDGSGLVTVTGLALGTSSTATITTSRTGYVGGSATVSSSSAASVLMAYEPFTGTAGNNMSGGTGSGSSGLTGNWQVVKSRKSNADAVSGIYTSRNGLAFPKNTGFTRPSSNTAASGPNWNLYYSARQLSTPISFDAPGTYYLSFLNHLPTVTWLGSALAGLLSDLPSTTSDTNPWTLLFGGAYGSKFVIDYGFANRASWESGQTRLVTDTYSAVSTNASAPTTEATANFVVVKIVTSASGNDSFSLKAYAPTSELPTSEPSSWDVTYAAPITGSAKFLAVETEFHGTIDEYRLGYTYQSVTDARAARTITFNANYSGGPSSTTQSIYSNIEVGLTSNTFTRTLNTFAGWNTQANGTGTPYANSASVTLSADTTLFAQWTSRDATLSALSISQGTISQTFASATTSYTASVKNSVDSITVTPTRTQANATIQVRVGAGSYASVTSGSASSALALSLGSNTVNVLVTAQDGTTNTYTITITRAPAISFINSLTAPSGVAMSPYQGITFQAATGGSETFTYTYSINNVVNAALPTGLTFNGSNRTITGTPTAAGTTGTIRIIATDTNGDVFTMSTGFTITVNFGTQLPISILTRFGTGGQPHILAIQGGSGIGDLTYTLDPLVQPSCLLSGFILTPNFPVGTSGACFVKATKAADAAFTQTSSAVTTIFFTAYVPVIQQTLTCPPGTTPSAPTGIGVGSCIQVLAPVSPAAGDSGAAPKITSLSATSGLVGASITITGTGFSTVTRVQFGTQSTTTFTATSTTITVAVPTGATRGRVMVFSPTGSAMAAQIFTVTVVDTQAPGFTGGSVNTSTPTQLTLNFDETIDGTGVLATSFAVSVAGTNRAITGISISGTTITLTLASAVSKDQEVLFTYTSPNSSASIKDALGNRTATITSRGLTNNVS